MLLTVEIVESYLNRLRINKYPMLDDDEVALSFLNEAIKRIAKELYCVEREHSVLVEEYLSETGTISTVTNPTNLIISGLDSSTNDYYNGWYFTDKTIGLTLPVRDYVGLTATIILSAPMTGTATSDNISIEKRNNEVALPKDFIEIKYVLLDDRELIKADEKDIRRQEAMFSFKGKPTHYGLTNSKLILYGKPSADEQITIHYYAEPRIALLDAAAAAGGAYNELDLPLRYKTVYPTYRIKNATVLILDGDNAGEEVVIQDVVDDTDSLLCYVYPDLSNTMAKGDYFCTEIDIPAEYQDMIMDYMLWQTYILRQQFQELAAYHKMQFDQAITEAQGREFRKKMPKQIHIGSSKTIFPARREFKGDIHSS